MLTNVSQAIAADVRNALADIVRGKLVLSGATSEIALNLLAFGVDDELTLPYAHYAVFMHLYEDMKKVINGRLQAGHVACWDVDDQKEHDNHKMCLAAVIWAVREARYRYQWKQIHTHEVASEMRALRHDAAAHRMNVWHRTGYKTPSTPVDWWY